MQKLGEYIMFWLVLLVMFSTMFNIIGKNEQDEYKTIGHFFAGIFFCLRLSVGDFNFDLLKTKPGEKEYYLL